MEPMSKVFGTYSYFGQAVFTDYTRGTPISKVFISYGRQQADWVENRLAPVLCAGGAEMPMLHSGGGEEVVDTERSVVGAQLAHRLLQFQDSAERQIIVLSEDYVANTSCLDQLKHAIALDPDFSNGLLVPVLRESCTLPDGISIPESAIIDLRNERRSTAWEQLLVACHSQLGTSAPAWLKARDEVLRRLQADQSVNLVVDSTIDGEPLITDVRGRLKGLATIDIDSMKAGTRRGFVTEVLRLAGCTAAVPAPPVDLELFDRFMASAETNRIALMNFDIVKRRLDFDQPMFESLAAVMASTPPRVVLLMVSQLPLNRLLLPHNPLVKMNLPTVTLAP